MDFKFLDATHGFQRHQGEGILVFGCRHLERNYMLARLQNGPWLFLASEPNEGYDTGTTSPWKAMQGLNATLRERHPGLHYVLKNRTEPDDLENYVTKECFPDDNPSA